MLGKSRGCWQVKVGCPFKVSKVALKKVTGTFKLLASSQALRKKKKWIRV